MSSDCHLGGEHLHTRIVTLHCAICDASEKRNLCAKNKDVTSSACFVTSRFALYSSRPFWQTLALPPLQWTKWRQCHYRHHTLLHIDRHIQPNDKGSTNHNRPAEAKGNPTAEVNTYCSFKGKPRNHILLATAVVEVQNKSVQYVPCRA